MQQDPDNLVPRTIVAQFFQGLCKPKNAKGIRSLSFRYLQGICLI